MGEISDVNFQSRKVADVATINLEFLVIDRIQGLISKYGPGELAR